MASLSEQVIVFSGFRNDALKEAIAAKGGRVVSALSGKTTMLLCQPDGKASSKPEKARALGMEIMDLDAFCEQYGFVLLAAKSAAKKPGQAPMKKTKKQTEPEPEPEPVPEPVKKSKAKAKANKANKARASPQTESEDDSDSEPEPAAEPVKKPKSAKKPLEKPVLKKKPTPKNA